MRDYMKQNRIEVQIFSTTKTEEHFHQDVELIYVLEGTLKLIVLEKEYILSHGDVLVVNANEKHSYTASDDILSAHIYITYSLIRQVYDGVSTVFFCNSLAEDSEKYIKLREILNTLLRYKMLYDTQQLEEKTEYAFISAFFRLLGQLTNHFLIKAASEENMTMQQKNRQRMMQIDEYIMNHYSEPISLKSLSENLYLSEGYLSRYFKKTYQMNFTSYLKQIRLAKAVDQLMYTDHPILRVALDNGFSSISFFNKVFKEEYGQSPSTIRNQAKEVTNKGEENTDYMILNERLEQYLFSQEMQEEKKTRGQTMKRQYSVLKSRKIEHFWNQAVNIGQAENLLDHRVQSQILQMKESMQFKYVRFWSIFSPNMLLKRDDKYGIMYNFTKLDKVTDFLVGHGLKPFLDLEEKIRRVNKTDKEYLLLEENKVEFASILQWEEFVKQLTLHWLRRYGMEELSTWKIEVFFDGYRIQGEHPVDSYFHIFKSIFSVVKGYIPDIEIGGCGFFPDFFHQCEKEGRNFWEEWLRKTPLPDFISIMSYTYEPKEYDGDYFGFEKKSEDPEYLMHSIHKMKEELVKHGFEGIKLYITEWNLTVSDRNILNDSCFQGAYIMKNVVDVYGDIDMLCYFQGTDLYTEFYDTMWLMHGGQGLLTKDGITKPAGFAFRFLKKLYPYFVDKSENFLITTNRRNNYSIVCHNMKNLNYYYYLKGEEQQEWGKLWKNFDDQSSLTLDISLKDVENGEYRVSIQKINDKNGSIQDIWGHERQKI